jgi:hypothetical protein
MKRTRVRTVRATPALYFFFTESGVLSEVGGMSKPKGFWGRLFVYCVCSRLALAARMSPMMKIHGENVMV